MARRLTRIVRQGTRCSARVLLRADLAKDGPVVLVMRGARVNCEPPGDEPTGDFERVMDCTREPVGHDIQGLGRGVGPGHIAFEMADCSTVVATFQSAQLIIVGPLIENRPTAEAAVKPREEPLAGPVRGAT